MKVDRTHSCICYGADVFWRSLLMGYLIDNFLISKIYRSNTLLFYRFDHFKTKSNDQAVYLGYPKQLRPIFLF